MSIGSIVSWIVCGLIVGMLARLLMPGRQLMSMPMTAGLGIVGALLGGFLYYLIRGGAGDPFSLASHNWYGWIVSILGAMLVLWVYPYVAPRSWSS